MEINTKTEKVLEVPRLEEDTDRSLKGRICLFFKEVISMLFEIGISFVPIFLYYLTFFLSDRGIDYYEHMKNGSIVWIFLAILIMGNFKVIVSRKHKIKFCQTLVAMAIILFMLFMIGVYLILNFATYGIVNLPLVESNVVILVILLGIATLVLNILRIAFFEC